MAEEKNAVPDPLSPGPGGQAGEAGRIYLIGFMGCGKSHWGRRLSEKLKTPFFDLDEQIEIAEARSINEVFATEGEEYFRRREQEVLMSLTETHRHFVMATGGGTPCFFNNIDFMNRWGTSVWLNCTAETLFSRLQHEQEKRPLVRNFDPEGLRAYITRKLGDRKIFYQQAELIVFEEDHNLEQLLASLFEPENNN